LPKNAKVYKRFKSFANITVRYLHYITSGLNKATLAAPSCGLYLYVLTATLFTNYQFAVLHKKKTFFIFISCNPLILIKPYLQPLLAP